MPTNPRPEPSSVDAPNRPNPPPGGGTPVGRPGRSRSLIWLVLGLAVVGAVVWLGLHSHRAGPAQPSARGGGRGGMGNFPVPVISGKVEQKEVPVYLDGLGTVQAFNTVTVHSRVDGQVIKVAFVEGQDVHPGDLLAQIDPAPFQAALDQSIARKAQDEAQLAIARLTLTRDKELLTSKILAQQDYDTQQATVDQLQATVRGDDAAINNAKIQLGYTTITSPLEGRTGLRMIDEGNIVHATDSNGLVVITQLRPISLTFTLPEQNLPQIQQHLPASGALKCLALDRDNRATLSEGKLTVIDNQIDISTGTIRLKAVFANEDLKLWPGQFVNVRLLLETRQGPVVPASVVQRGPDGDFAFVIDSDMKAEVRRIKVGQIDRGQALIEEGLKPGEMVVVDGQYKLQPGSKVKQSDSKEPAGPPGSGPNNSTGKAVGTL
jgi:membrane fusion protein, multidrug efflux system